MAFFESILRRFASLHPERERQLQRYRLLSEVTRDIILFIDREKLTVIDANEAALAAYRYERSELIGKSATILRSGPSLSEEMLKLSDSPAGLSLEALQLRSDGTVFPGEARARTAEVNGRDTIIVTMRDITERRQAAEQVALALGAAVEVARIKSEFVATISHEIRTPMHAVLAMSELLLGGNLPPLQREYAATLSESAHALHAIINDILDFSKLEANELVLEQADFDPAHVVASVVSVVELAARDKGLTIRSQSSPDVPGALRGDPARLRQTLLCLASNAVKFTNAGSVTITTSLEHDDGKTVSICFAVTDTGIGISAEARERLFEPFIQGDGSPTRRFEGTGLGLSLASRLVELMRGRIWFGDRDGPGSTFSFTVPLERA